MEIMHKSTSVNDFVNALKERLEYLDQTVFKKPLNIQVASQRVGTNYVGACTFMTKRTIFKLLGFKDSYIIFAKNNYIEKISKIEYMATCVAAHEVRHRFQKSNSGKLISFDFLKKTKYIPEEMLKYIYMENSNRYLNDSVLFLREFDASVIEHLIILGYKHKNFSMENVVQLIQCNEKTLGNILNQVIHPE